MTDDRDSHDIVDDDPIDAEVVDPGPEPIPPEPEAELRFDAQLVRNAPQLTRIAAEVWWRATKWGLAASARNGLRLARAAGDPVLVSQIANEIGFELREYARDLLGITELDHQVRLLMPGVDPDSSNGSSNGVVAPEDAGLRVRGAQLLRAAAEIDPHEHAHPAYARILTELAPDEGRILRLLATAGPQASVDVRSANLIGGVGSEAIAEGMTMIGAEAGLQRRDRVPAYLNNLERLGLIWFSREPIDDSVAYQVLEAQPEVMGAIKKASRTKTVQRSIKLTPFGKDFCDVCLPLDTAEMEALSEPRPSSD
ncbi:MAG: Abi-alpha family protein [Solirubrobacteraceae bacterium]